MFQSLSEQNELRMQMALKAAGWLYIFISDVQLQVLWQPVVVGVNVNEYVHLHVQVVIKLVTGPHYCIIGDRSLIT